jgi:hypothetical protein
MTRKINNSLRAATLVTLFALAGSALSLAGEFEFEALAPQGAGQEVDLALVLTVDISGSIDYGEAELQRKGIAEAFLSREVVQAIQSGSRGQIAVSVVYFSSRDYGVMSVPVNWTIVRDQETAQRFVSRFLGAQRQRGIGTSISDALALSQRTLAALPYRTTKQVIDISGDGVNNAGRPVLQARDEVLAKGITINALPIMDDTTPDDLDRYFRACVIGGPAAFVLPAEGFTDFARAMRRKLVLEISGLTPEESANGLLVKAAAAAPPRPAPRANAPTYPGGCDFPMF